MLLGGWLSKNNRLIRVRRIDTPGVIDRVSTLFRGHPSLIQGFNTFLPPGYRIECYGTEGDVGGLITVTTPTGTVSQVPGGLSAAMDQRDREHQREQAAAAAAAAEQAAAANQNFQPPPPAQQTPHTASYPARAPASTPATQPPSRQVAPPTSVPIPPQHPMPASGPSTPGAAQFLATGGLGHQSQSQGGGSGRAPILEFNHAISFVNKIKNRFNSEPETYKNFLEILQTYQRDQKIDEVSKRSNTADIEVYEQVIDLFKNAPDLLAEFKQFLPESGGGGFPGFGSFVQAAAGQTGPAPPGQKRKDAKEPASKKRSKPNEKGGSRVS